MDTGTANRLEMIYPTNRECGLVDRRETGEFYSTDDVLLQ